MKIKIAFTPEDSESAAVAHDALLRLYPRAKVRESEKHPPFKHIYLTTAKPPKPHV